MSDLTCIVYYELYGPCEWLTKDAFTQFTNELL
jgi:hypothetical protein